jgi:hypothetical protein
LKRQCIALLAFFLAIVFASSPAMAKKSASGSSKQSHADYRSAKSGKYVKKEHADRHKSTTVREERKKN